MTTPPEPMTLVRMEHPMTTNATVHPRHKDKAREFLDCLLPRSVIAQTLANLEAATNRLAEIDHIADRLTDQRNEPDFEMARLHYWRDKAIKAAHELRSLASGHTLSAYGRVHTDGSRSGGQRPACPSCEGRNTSCPEGCERDPETGEWMPPACPERAAGIARNTMVAELSGLKMEDPYRAGIKWSGERIQDAIRAAKEPSK